MTAPVFDPDSCWRDDEARFAEDPTTGHVGATECTCAGWCGDPGEAGCCYCNHRDVYDECPVVGFGCGTGHPAGTPHGCKNGGEPCCTPEQWAAACDPA